MYDVAGYVRVSTQGQSLDRQLEGIHDYQDLMDDVEAGHYDAVVVYEVSRVARSIRDLSRTVDRVRDAGTELHIVSEGIAARQENEEYHHGPAPLGFEKAEGQLVEAADYQRVVEVLDRVVRGELSQRQAAKELDTSRRTVQRSVEERAELYGL